MIDNLQLFSSQSSFLDELRVVKLVELFLVPADEIVVIGGQLLEVLFQEGILRGILVGLVDES